MATVKFEEWSSLDYIKFCPLKVDRKIKKISKTQLMQIQLLNFTI